MAAGHCFKQKDVTRQVDNLMNITLTECAVRELRKILLEQPARQMKFIRIGIKGGGCAGLTYTLDLIAEPRKHDRIVESRGIRLVCDRVSALYLHGCTIDFSDEVVGRGFTFNNPVAAETCPCGASFGI
jgi:iron-sulfur cluster assembly accessory protein